MPPQLEILITSVDTRMDCALPTIEFALRVSNRAGEVSDLCILNCEIYLAKKPTPHAAKPTITQEDLYLDRAQVFIGSLRVGESREAKIQVPLSIDLNNVIHEKFLTLEAEELTFKLKFSGFYLFSTRGSAPHSVSPITFFGPPIHEVSLSIEKWRRMISSYYRNLTWLAVSRETYAELKKMMEEKGYTSYDELIRDLLEGK